MHYTIDYEGLGPTEKYNKAIQDIKDYMGEDKFNTMTQRFRGEYPGGENMPLDRFELIVSFAGVQGYPAKAWHQYIYGTQGG